MAWRSPKPADIIALGSAASLRIGLIGSVVFGGAMAVLIAGARGWLFPELRRVRRFDEVDAA